MCHYYTSTIPTEAVTTTILIGKTCYKCGILKKSGKLSCCARGGDWFKNCGDVGGSNFDHTWVEGTQACTRFTSLSSVESPALLMMPSEGSNTQPLNTDRTPKATLNQTNIYSSTTDDSEDCAELAKLVVCASLLLISFHLYM